MRPAILIAAAAVVAAAYVVKVRGRGDASEVEPEPYDVDPFAGVFGSAVEESAQLFDRLTGGEMKLSAMSKVTQGQIQNPNVQAFLRVIRRGEGTSDDAGFRRIFGGQLFDSFADHPRILIVKNGYRSTAAGAYQFIVGTWDETRKIMGLNDFSPAAQTRGAVGRIAARGALDDVIAGRFEAAIKKCAKEWASLPYSPYGQPVITMAVATNVYTAAGGTISA